VIRAVDKGSIEGYDAGAWCSLGCAIGWGVDASSSLETRNGALHTAAMADDGLPNTAWIQGRPWSKVRQRFIFRFRPQDLDYEGGSFDSVSFWGLRVINGYCRDSTTWKEYSRAKVIRVYHNKDTICDALLADSMSLQEVKFPEFFVHLGDSVCLEVRSLYKGTKIVRPAISELVPLGSH